MKTSRLTISVLAMMMSSVAIAATINVPGNYASIADAVSHAGDGDTVLVADGVYEISAQIEVSKPITLRSVNGCSVTEIRRVGTDTTTASFTERCLYINNENAVIDGFTISNGRIYNQNGGSEAEDWIGAGVLITANGGTIQNSSITNCLTGRQTVYGAGLGMMGTKGVVRNCTISDNGMGYQYAGKANGWTIHAAGVYMEGGVIEDSIITRNNSVAQNGSYGAGIYAKGGTIRRTSIVDNIIYRAESGGGNHGAGIYAPGAATFENCLIARNRTNRGEGGGAYVTAACVFRNCTFADNEAMQYAGAYLGNNSAKAFDCVFSGNRVYSDISAGAPDWGCAANTVFSNCLASVDFNARSIDCVKGRAYFLDSDFTLSPASALAGIGWKLPAAGTADFVRTGKTAVVGDEVEFTYGVQGNSAARAVFTQTFNTAGIQQITYGGVTKPVMISEKNYNVSSVADLETAVATAQDGATINVASGEYALTDQLQITNAIKLVSVNGRESTTLKRNVSKPVNNPSGYDDRIQIVNRVLRIDNEDAVVSGFTLTGGWTFDGNINYYIGAGGSGAIVGSNGGFLADTTITGCGQARMNKGGALSVIGRHSVASNCTVTANTSSGWRMFGGGAWISGGGTITHSVISDNSISTGNQNFGGGVYALGGYLSHSRITGNSIANQEGGGAGIYSASADFFCDNCLIENNISTGRAGGGVYGTAGNFINCTIVGNSASAGGGVYGDNANLRFQNCIIQGNAVTADTSAGAPEWYGTKTVYSNSCSTVDLPTADAGNIRGTVSFEVGSSYKLAAGSIAFDSGSVEHFADYVCGTDIDGNDRVWGDSIDIGCYEYFSTERYSASVTPPAGVILQGHEAEFTASIVNPQGLPLTCEWYVSGSSAPHRSGNSYNATFADAGFHTVVLVVRDGDNAREFECDVYVVPVNLYVVAPETENHLAVFPYATAETAATNLLDAVAAANDGSTIHIAAGIHPVTNEVAITAALTIVGEDGAANTVICRKERNNSIHCQTQFRVLSINNPNAVVRGVSLENGYLNAQKVRGAGAYIGALGGTLADSIVSNNMLWANMYTYGAGVFLDGGVVSNCLICCNTNMTQVGDAGAYGGGVCLNRGVLRESRVERNIIFENANNKPTTAIAPGAGVAFSGNAVMLNTLIAYNHSEGAVGGIAYQGGNAVVSNCTVIANTAVTTTCSSGDDFTPGNTSPTAEIVNTVYGVNAATESANATRVACETVDLTEFKNVAKGDFRPRQRQGSPLFRKGVYGDWMESAVDLAGRPRATSAHRVDIGAYQGTADGMTVIFK